MSGHEPRHWRSAEGLNLFARDYAGAGGEARLPVVCLHGLTRNSRDFENVSPWIAARQRRVLALDMRGRGHSERDPAENYDIATYVADITALLTQLGIGRAIFVGTSMGGLITVELGTLYPELVAGAVINDIGPQLSMVGLGRIAGYVGQGKPLPDWQAAADACAAMNADVFAHYGPADWMAMARRLFREEGGQVIADYDPGIARALARIVADPDPWGKWHRFADARPVLVLRGTVTDLLDADVAEAMVAGKPRAVLAPVAGVGHAPMMDEPDARAAMGRFFDRVD
ncbi:alpha/beta fold hydrolase [Novosphingobium sediminicola]|uniref:Pimeloyl-ACP methyl ester carboxylesterase n=1 Tax=Novosphingobium sediminicola TaxID=563162 RepID=A0A7W6G6E7_9SPHN|nr:alpha/beta hydrolase [Novosphingobium sediminicola]MBB3955060.1 pimeloyl-ACP methyl ester carboxylesterase [Novosphingobium sediminicola]